LVTQSQAVAPSHNPHPINPQRERRSPGSSVAAAGAKDWWLGIDLGTTAIAATLFHWQTQQYYPLYWSDPDQPNAEQLFQLPSVGYFPKQPQSRIPALPSTVGYAALQAGTLALSTTGQMTGLLLHSFKPYLNSALPYYSPQSKQWEPIIQRSETQALPLILVQQTLVSLLTSLTPTANRSTALTCRAQGLDPKTFAAAMRQLAGVAINQPTSSSDAYRFNLREAILSAGLVQEPEQIFCVEDAVAAMLAELAPTEPQKNSGSAGRNPSKMPQGGMFVLSAGAIATNMALVDVPLNVQDLAAEDFYLRRIPYAGNALDQDIICQLLYPSAQGWETLELDQLNLPLPGEPDLEPRYRLQQRLESSPLGRSLLSSVRQIKPTLCQQDVTYILDTQRWSLSRKDLLNWVLLPYLQQLNREINFLLSQAAIPAGAVRRVVCTGGTATISIISLWLQQKFPQARLSIDSSVQQSTMPMQRIANGLAALPNFSQVCDRDRHQYSDFFILHKLLECLPNSAEPTWSVGGIVALLAEQGLHSQISQPFAMNLLAGQLPTGLVPTTASSILLTPESQHNPEYQAISVAPLFTRQENQFYALNLQQRDRLWQHLQTILTNTHQTLAEPLAIAPLSSPSSS
jgi:hypothetical protein